MKNKNQKLLQLRNELVIVQCELVGKLKLGTYDKLIKLITKKFM